MLQCKNNIHKKKILFLQEVLLFPAMKPDDPNKNATAEEGVTAAAS